MPEKDVEASSTAGRCPKCLQPLDLHNFKVSDFWRGKSTPEGNSIFECSLKKKEEPPAQDWPGDYA